ncbi:MAG: hypothetical protein PHO53_04245 [Actinomycetota bacterium]|nr:hypothetical protein [Actinomycetota bacterium]
MNSKRTMRAIIWGFTSLSLVVAAILLFCSTSSADDTVPIEELIDNMKKYDGETVSIEGEVIGDCMVRGDYAWITVNDDAYSRKSLQEGSKHAGVSNIGIGVWIPKGETKSIEFFGDYKTKGDIVKVRGTFHMVDSEHGGDTDVHATHLEVVKSGYRFHHPFQYRKLLIVLALGVLIVVLWSRRPRKPGGIS